MTQFTIFSDISGRVTQKKDTPMVTVAGVAIKTEHVNRIRALIPSGFPKWGKCDHQQAVLITELLVNEAVAVSALCLNCDTPEWETFWVESEKLRVEITKQDRGKVGFVKASNLVRYYLFGWAVAVATAHAVKIGTRTKIVDWQGLEIIEQTVGCDADLNGKETIDIFREFWTKRGDQPKTRSIGFKFITRSVSLETEEQEPLLYLADYLAGLVHCSRSTDLNRNRFPLTQQQSFNCLTRITSSGKAQVNNDVFNLHFRDIFGQVMDAAGL